jgi:hypothetical protein
MQCCGNSIAASPLERNIDGGPTSTCCKGEGRGGELLPVYYQTDCNVFWFEAICLCSGAFTAKDVGRLNFA